MHFTIGTWRIAIEQIKPSLSQLANSYDIVAPTWHQTIRRIGFLKAYERLIAQLDAANLLPEGGVLLDVGIGSGGLSEGVSKTIKRPFSYTGIDISPAMLSQSQQRFAQLNQPIQLAVQDVRRLPWKDNQFDWVMGAHILEHLEQPFVGLSEMVRVLKPGRPLLLVMTRRNITTSWLNVQWALNRMTKKELDEMMADAGVERRQFFAFKRPFWCACLSIACIGFKQAT